MNGNPRLRVRALRRLVALLALVPMPALTAGPHIGAMGGIGDVTSTSAGGEPSSGKYSINGTTGIGVMTGMRVGAIATDWSNSYDGPGAYASLNTFKAVSRQGGRSAVFASRLSDTATTSGLINMENVVQMAILDSKPTNIIGGGWNVYSQSNLYSAAAPTVTGLGFIAHEDSIYNQWTSPMLDPFQTNVLGYAENFRPDCGIGSGSPTVCSDAIHIINNGAAYKSGIIFASDALDTGSSTHSADAMAMGPWQGLGWYRAASQEAWGIFSTATTGNHYMLLRDASGVGDMFVSEASLSLNGASGSTARNVNYKTGDLYRWQVGATNTTESGSNVGSDFCIGRFNDAGTLQDTPFCIRRTNGLATLTKALLLTPGTYSALPVCNTAGEGMLASVSDGSSATFNASLGGSGSNHVMGYCNGTNWTVH